MTEHRTSLEQFIRGETELSQFSHRDHVQMGFETLRRHSGAGALVSA